MTPLEIAAINLATSAANFEAAREAADRAARETRQFAAYIERQKVSGGDAYRSQVAADHRKRRKIAKACTAARRLEHAARLEMLRCERLLDAAVNSDSVAL